MTESRPIRAISIRQPYVELILRGLKKFEYRNRPTTIRETVYIYASLTPASDWNSFRAQIDDAEPGDLPTGVIVGTVEITECSRGEKGKQWAYVLKNPRRFRRALKAVNQAQPCFWRPRF